MTEPAPPSRAPARPAAETDRELRLAEALRANLHRRKAQARARRDQPAAGPESAAESAAESPAAPRPAQGSQDG